MINGNIDFIMLDINLSVTDSYNLTSIYYIMVGRILDIGIKYAPTSEINVRNCLLSLLDRFLPFYQYANPDIPTVPISKINALTTLVDTLIIFLCMVICSTEGLMVFKGVKYLHEVITGRHSDIYSFSKDTKTESTSNWERRQENFSRLNDNTDVPEFETIGFANDIVSN